MDDDDDNDLLQLSFDTLFRGYFLIRGFVKRGRKKGGKKGEEKMQKLCSFFLSFPLLLLLLLLAPNDVCQSLRMISESIRFEAERRQKRMMRMMSLACWLGSFIHS